MSSILNNDLKTLYFDDYNPAKKYYRILFKPGRAVQARELTQIQTLLQAQIERVGNYMFVSGDNVFPGNTQAVRFTSNIGFIKLPANPGQNTATLQQLETHWMNRTVVCSLGANPGVQAKVVGYRGPDAINNGEVRLFIQYLNASTNGNETEFRSGDTISTVQTLNETTNELEGGVWSLTIPNDSVYKKTGFVSRVSTDTPYSIYYYNGFFVYVENQSIFLTPATTAENPNPDDIAYQNSWGNATNALIGLKITESTVDFQEDDTLLDNATGAPNYSAPGADRLRIEATLVQKPIQDPNAEIVESADFISLVLVSRGPGGLPEVKYLINYTRKDAAALEQTLARRTYDESGDYVVSPFLVHIKEFLLDKEDDIDGAHDLSEFSCLTKNEAELLAEEKFLLTKKTVNDQIAFQHTDGKWYPGLSLDGKTTQERPSFKDLCKKFVSVKIDPGKAYVKGYEIQKLGREIIDIPKSRTKKYFNNQIIATPIGSYFSVTDLSGCPDFSKLIDVDLYDVRIRVNGARPTSPGQKIGTAKIVFIDTPNLDDNRIYITNLQLNSGKALFQVKSLFAAATTVGTAVTANIKPTEVELEGVCTRINPTTNSINTDKTILYGSGTTWKNSTKLSLKVGDYIRVGADPTLYRVAENPSSDSSIKIEEAIIGYTTSNAEIKRKISADYESDPKTPAPDNKSLPPMWQNGSKIYACYAGLYNSGDDGFIYELPTPFVSNVRTSNDDGDPSENTDMSYTIPFIVNGDQNQGIEVSEDNTYDFTLPASATAFGLVATGGYKVIVNGGDKSGTWMKVQFGNAQPQTQGVVNINIFSEDDVQKVRFHFHPLDAEETDYYTIIVPLVKNGEKALERKKYLRRGYFNANGEYQHTGNRNGITGKGVKIVDQTAHGEIVLDEEDVFTITRIIASNDPSSEPTTKKDLTGTNCDDISGLYIFDNGQRDHYYGPGVLTFNTAFSAKRPLGKVRVEYDYFDHEDSGGGTNKDYFSADSYVDVDDFGNIPTYQSKTNGKNYALSDCLDFRRKLSDTISGKVPIESVTCDYFVYEGRKDKICLDSVPPRKFVLMTGTPDINPDPADDLPTGMTICEITQSPYGYSSKTCLLRLEENARYTMKDIARLEKRIKNLEYYTALSLLESNTKNLTITDAKGNNRFKNGFLVDNFQSHASSDMSSSDYKCSLDEDQSEAQPFTTTDNIAISEAILYPTNSETPDQKQARRIQAGYQLVGSKAKGYTFILPIVKKKIFISQQIASQVSNVNPYSSFTYVGALTINPWTDEWFDTAIVEAPPIIDDSAYKTALRTKDGTFTRSRPIITKEVEKGKRTRVNTKSGPGSNGELVAVGHRQMEHLWKTNRKLYGKVKRDKKFVVPEPYANAGAVLPYPTPGDRPDGQSGAYGVRDVYKQSDKITTTSVVQEIHYSVKQGEDKLTSRAMVESKITNIEFMRPREIEFNGECFLPGVKLFAFFDGIPVSDLCRPVVDGSNGWYENISVVASKTEKDVLIIASATNTFPGDATTGIRPGCEVVIYNTSVTPPQISEKFDVVEILASRTAIRIKEKNIIGLPAAETRPQYPTTQKAFTGTINIANKKLITNVSGLTTADVFLNQVITGGYIPANTRVTGFNTSGTTITSINIDTDSTVGANTNIPDLYLQTPAPFNISISKFAFGDKIQADRFGNVKGVFKIPNENGRQIKCGDVLFTLSTSERFDNMNSASSKANTRYTARGWLNAQTMQSYYVRKFDIKQDKKTIETPTVTFEDRTTYGNISWYDPIAQTFLVDESEGCYLTDVDVFFHKKPTDKNDGSKIEPIRLEIRTTDETTTPTGEILGGDTLGRVVLQASDVITNVPYGSYIGGRLLSEGIVVSGSSNGKTDATGYYWSGGDATNATAVCTDRQRTGANTSKIYSDKKFITTRPSLDMVPTRFSFPTPLYLEQGKVYAVVLISDSDEYEVWVAQRGKQEARDVNTVDYQYQKLNTPNFEIGTDINLDGQELFKNGDFYKSKNGRGWLIDPKITFKFALHKAEFSKNTGVITFVNDAVDAKKKIFRDGMSVHASVLANGNPDHVTASKIRIVSPNHGFIVGDRIVLDMDSSLENGSPELKGFLLKYLEDPAGHQIISTEQDHFTIQITNNGSTNEVGCYATSSGRIGGANTYAQINMRFTEAVLSAVSAAIPGKTSIEWSIETTTTKGVNDPRNVAVNQKVPPISITPGRRVEFSTPMRINNPIMEQGATITDKKSVVIKAFLKTSNENLTPQLSYEQLSLSLASSRLNNPCGAPDATGVKQNINVPGFDDLVVLDNVKTTASAYNSSGKELVFTSSSGTLSGTFAQDDQSRTIYRYGSGLPELSSELAPGDRVTDTDTNDSRIVYEVYSNYFTVNEPFNPAFPLPNSGVGKVLRTNPPHMKIKTSNRDIADAIAQMDVGKYASLVVYQLSNAQFTKVTDSKVGFGSEHSSGQLDRLVLGVDYTPNALDPDPDLDHEPCLCTVTVDHYNTNATTVSNVQYAKLIQRDRFIDEIAPHGGSAAAKYVCKPLQLDNQCEALKITFDGQRDSNSSFDLYYKIKPANSQEKMSDINWVKATFNLEQNGVLVNTTPPAEDGVFKTYEASINGLVPFDMCQAKIVMLGGNPARPPKIKNFTLIALAD